MWKVEDRQIGMRWRLPWERHPVGDVPHPRIRPADGTAVAAQRDDGDHVGGKLCGKRPGDGGQGRAGATSGGAGSLRALGNAAS